MMVLRLAEQCRDVWGGTGGAVDPDSHFNFPLFPRRGRGRPQAFNMPFTSETCGCGRASAVDREAQDTEGLVRIRARPLCVDHRVEPNWSQTHSSYGRNEGVYNAA